MFQLPTLKEGMVTDIQEQNEIGLEWNLLFRRTIRDRNARNEWPATGAILSLFGLE